MQRSEPLSRKRPPMNARTGAAPAVTTIDTYRRMRPGTTPTTGTRSPFEAAVLPQEIDERPARARDMRREQRARPVGLPFPHRVQNRMMLLVRPRLAARQRELQPDVAIALVLQALHHAHRQRPVSGRQE